MIEDIQTFSPWKRWCLEKKDLSNLPLAKNYACPKCGTNYPEDIEEGYEIDGENYPQMYNEYLSATEDGTIHDWDEVHCCPKCKTKYVFRNGCF